MSEPPKSEFDFIYRDFEAMGEAKVREAVTIGRFGKRQAHAVAWLQMQDHSRETESDRERRFERSEDRRIARSAKNAAWIAAIAAIIAAICATIVLVHPAPPSDIKPVAPKVESP